MTRWILQTVFESSDCKTKKDAEALIKRFCDPKTAEWLIKNCDFYKKESK